MALKAQKEPSWIGGQQRAFGPLTWGQLELQKNLNISPKY